MKRAIACIAILLALLFACACGTPAHDYSATETAGLLTNAQGMEASAARQDEITETSVAPSAGTAATDRRAATGKQIATEKQTTIAIQIVKSSEAAKTAPTTAKTAATEPSTPLRTTAIVTPKYTTVITGPNTVKSGESVQLHVTATDADGNVLQDPEGGDWSWYIYVNGGSRLHGTVNQSAPKDANSYAINRDGLFITGQYAYPDTVYVTYSNNHYGLHATCTVGVVE